jgi:hypothetical protein
LKEGGGTPQLIAYVVAWALFTFQRLTSRELRGVPRTN